MNYTPKRKPTAEALNGDYRYEVKFVLDESALPTLLAWVRSHPAGFVTAYPTRQVNSLYFDTNDWASLFDGLGGLTSRGKLRFRWYGPDISRPDCMLELKHKRGSLGTKISRPIEAIDLRGANWGDIVRDLDKQDLGPLVPVLARSHCPVLLNHYQRRYNVSADRTVRLTIDTELVCYDQTFAGRPNLDRPEPRQPVMVLELKGLWRHERRISEVAGQLPMRSCAFSKFTSGVCGLAYST
ncbi:MAG: VTC domain-containing protein [Planctomycetes bacterium]|nr:VTC domain-containing protein [Planctomycetota bacterium]